MMFSLHFPVQCDISIYFIRTLIPHPPCPFPLRKVHKYFLAISLFLQLLLVKNLEEFVNSMWILSLICSAPLAKTVSCGLTPDGNSTNLVGWEEKWKNVELMGWDKNRFIIKVKYTPTTAAANNNDNYMEYFFERFGSLVLAMVHSSFLCNFSLTENGKVKSI